MNMKKMEKNFSVSNDNFNFSDNFFNGVDLILDVDCPQKLIPGKSSSVCVEYAATESRDIIIFLEDMDGQKTLAGLTKVTVEKGKGKVNINFFTKYDIEVNRAYRIVVILTKVDEFLGGQIDRREILDIFIKSNISIKEEDFEEKNIILNVLPYTNLCRGQVYTIFVDYLTTEVSDIIITLEDGDNGNVWCAFDFVMVKSGLGTAQIDLKVSESAPIHDNYKIVVRLTTIKEFIEGELDRFVVDNVKVKEMLKLNENIAPRDIKEKCNIFTFGKN